MVLIASGMLQVLKTKGSLVSSVFFMCLPTKVFFPLILHPPSLSLSALVRLMLQHRRHPLLFCILRSSCHISQPHCQEVWIFFFFSGVLCYAHVGLKSSPVNMQPRGKSRIFQ